MILAGDCGATKTILSIWKDYDHSSEPIVTETFDSTKIVNLAVLANEFLTKHNNYDVNEACFGVAGPVIKGVAKLTNINLIVNEKEISKKLGFEVTIVNDMILHCYSIPAVSKKSFVTVCESLGKVNDTMNLVIAPGTGLGQAFFIKSGKGIVPYPSEASHRELSVYDDQQQDFANFLLSKNLSCEYDKILCGRGIELTYEYLSGAIFNNPEMSLIRDVATIFEEALDDTNVLAINCVSLFSRTLLDYCRELALILLPFGGIYITGGIIQKNYAQLEDYFDEYAFRDNAIMKHLLEKIEVKFVVDELAALRGAVYFLNSKRNS